MSVEWGCFLHVFLMMAECGRHIVQSGAIRADRTRRPHVLIINAKYGASSAAGTSHATTEAVGTHLAISRCARLYSLPGARQLDV